MTQIEVSIHKVNRKTKPPQLKAEGHERWYNTSEETAQEAETILNRGGRLVATVVDKDPETGEMLLASFATAVRDILVE